MASAWRRGALPFPGLSVQDLAGAAQQAEGLDDFGGEEWRPALDRLTDSLESEAQLNPLGRAMAHGQLVKALRERLRAAALLRRHPEIEAIPIRAPVVVLGSMRSGTTRMQRLLACDPRLAHTRGFESLSPVPGRGGQPRRVATVALGLAALRLLHPVISQIHPSRATVAEEEFGFFNPSLVSAQFVTQWRVPGYAAWTATADRSDAYRWFGRLLQINAWARRRPERRPWILKAPEFMDDLAGLLAIFPDARFIHLRRDAQAAVPSSASLTWQHRRLHSDHADPREVGADVLSLVRRRVEASAAVMASRPHLPRVDLDYGALDRDWRGAMGRVYDMIGLPLTSEVQRRMERYLAGAREHRGHRYSAAAFGLDEATIAASLPQEA